MENQKIIALILVRMGSTRLPGKALKVLDGKPLLEHIIDRVISVDLIDEVVVCTSSSAENQIIVSYCKNKKVACYAGSEGDVSQRMLDALNYFGATVGVTIFGDCPLIDPEIIRNAIEIFLANKYDFVGNDLKTTFPPGMEVEVFNVDALKYACKLNQDPLIREHGTLVIRNAPEKFDLHNIEAQGKFRRPELEIEVDEPDDLLVIEYLLKQTKIIGKSDLSTIIDILDSNKEMASINQNISRKWKEFRVC